MPRVEKQPSVPPGPLGTRETVLLTGADGLIGSRIIKQIDSRYNIVGLDRPPSPKDAPGIDYIQCDLTMPDQVERAMQEVRQRHGSRIASVIHLAAYYDFAGEPSPLYEALTVDGTRRLLRELQQFDVEQFIFSSSLLVMKPTEPGDPVDETSPTEGTWDYPRSKLEAEEVIRKERGKIPALILRLAGVYDEDGHSIPIGQQIVRIYEKQLESYFFPGDAEHGQAFVHLDDLVDAFALAIERRLELAPYEVLLIAEPDVVSYEDLQEIIGGYLHGSEWPTIRIPKTVAKAGAWVKDKMAGDEEQTFIKPWMIDLADQHLAVDIDQARRKLSWEPQHRLRDTLPEILKRLKADPRGWYQRNGFPYPT